jgi:hypothetical protein
MYTTITSNTDLLGYLHHVFMFPCGVWGLGIERACGVSRMILLLLYTAVKKYGTRQVGRQAGRQAGCRNEPRLEAGGERRELELATLAGRQAGRRCCKSTQASVPAAKWAASFINISPIATSARVNAASNSCILKKLPGIELASVIDNCFLYRSTFGE